MDILSFIHEHYVSLTSDLLAPQNQPPLFLRAVKSQRMDIMELVLNSQSKRPVSDRIFSQAYIYDLGDGLACECKCYQLSLSAVSRR